MKRRAFTLIELLTVMAVIAILASIAAPIAMRAKNAATRLSAMNTVRQLMPATTMYMADADDRFPVAFYGSMDGPVAWYGSVSPDGKVDPKGGLLAPYHGGRISKDPTHRGLAWKGDMTGFGYNWGFLGSSYYYGWDRFDWRPTASMSELSDTTKTIAFATSAYYFAGWNEGNGLTYDYGYIDPPFAWNGAPTVDCRHMGEKQVLSERKEVASTGFALAQFVDGSTKPLRLGEIKNSMFERQPKD